MYCSTKLSSLTCVLNELLLWSHISSEHPIFIKTVAELSRKNLPAPTVERLMQINRTFQSIQQDTDRIKRIYQSGGTKPISSNQVVLLIDRFMKNNAYVISFYPELRKYGTDDAVWQTQIEHILHEQKFMQELMTDLRSQLTD